MQPPRLAVTLTESILGRGFLQVGSGGIAPVSILCTSTGLLPSTIRQVKPPYPTMQGGHVLMADIQDPRRLGFQGLGCIRPWPGPSPEARNSIACDDLNWLGGGGGR